MADVGVLIKFLMLLMRAWLRAIDSRGTFDLRNVLALDSFQADAERGRDSWLALAMSSIAFAGRSGISKRVASAAGNPECDELDDGRLAGRLAGWGSSWDNGLCGVVFLRFPPFDMLTIDMRDGLVFGCRKEIGVAVSTGENDSSMSRSALNASDGTGESRTMEYRSYLKSAHDANDAWKTGRGDGGTTTRSSSSAISRTPSSSGVSILRGSSVLVS